MPSAGLSVALRALRRRLPVPIALTLIATIIHLFPPSAHVLEFNRTALGDGQLWRILTGHLVHFGVDHLLWDAATLLVLGALLPARHGRDWFGLLAGSALAIAGSLWWLQPHFELYRGLSGLVCAVFGAGLADVFHAARRERDRSLALIVVAASAGFLAKTAYELVTQRAFFVATADDFTPVPLAHLVGFACGVAFAHCASMHARARRQFRGASMSPTFDSASFRKNCDASGRERVPPIVPVSRTFE